MSDKRICQTNSPSGAWHTERHEELAAEAQTFFERLQARICEALEAEDGAAKFLSDRWQRPGGGGGLTRVLAGGALFEKAGVNTSAVHGELQPRLRGHAARRRARASSPPASRSCCTRRARACPRCTRTSAASRAGARCGSAAAPI